MEWGSGIHAVAPFISMGLTEIDEHCTRFLFSNPIEFKGAAAHMPDHHSIQMGNFRPLFL